MSTRDADHGGAADIQHCVPVNYAGNVILTADGKDPDLRGMIRIGFYRTGMSLLIEVILS